MSCSHEVLLVMQVFALLYWLLVVYIHCREEGSIGFNIPNDWKITNRNYHELNGVANVRDGECRGWWALGLINVVVVNIIEINSSLILIRECTVLKCPGYRSKVLQVWRGGLVRGAKSLFQSCRDRQTLKPPVRRSSLCQLYLGIIIIIIIIICNSGLIKMRSQLEAQFMPYTLAHSAYFIVSRQNNVVFRERFIKKIEKN